MAGDRLAPRDIACCGLVAALVFVWPAVGTIALRHVLLGALLILLLADAAVRAHVVEVLRDLAAPIVALALLTGWIVIHDLTLTQYPAYSRSEFRGQWLKPLLVFGIGLLLAARTRHTPPLLPALTGAIRWALVIQLIVVLGDLFYLWLRDVHLPPGTVRLTGTRTSISHSVLLLLSIMAADWLREAGTGSFTAGRRHALVDAGAVALALSCLVLLGSRYGIVLSVALLLIVAGLIAWRQVRRGSARRALVLIALAGCIAVLALTQAVRFDPRWERMTESAALAFAPGHEDDWRLFSDEHKPRFDDGTPVESSAFLRVARFRAGLDLIAQRPLGWGFGRSAMEHIVQMQFGVAQVASDSGMVDWTLALGVPGIVLWLAFPVALIAIGWRHRGAVANPAPMLLVIVVSVFLVRFVIDINTRDHMLEEFLFLCALLGGAATAASARSGSS